MNFEIDGSDDRWADDWRLLFDNGRFMTEGWVPVDVFEDFLEVARRMFAPLDPFKGEADADNKASAS